MNWLFIMFEVWLTNRLTRSPTFHRGVGAIHKRIHEFKHGKDPAEMGGTNIDKVPSQKKFLEYYIEELKEQFRGNSPPKKWCDRKWHTTSLEELAAMYHDAITISVNERELECTAFGFEEGGATLSRWIDMVELIGFLMNQARGQRNNWKKNTSKFPHRLHRVFWQCFEYAAFPNHSVEFMQHIRQ